jgi:hypothetical protein
MPRLRELPHKPRLPNHLVRPLDQAQNLGQVDLVQSLGRLGQVVAQVLRVPAQALLAVSPEQYQR